MPAIAIQRYMDIYSLVAFLPDNIPLAGRKMDGNRKMGEVVVEVNLFFCTAIIRSCRGRV